MGDQYPGYCPHCVDKDKPNTEIPCVSNGYPSFWPHSYPNCFRVAEGVEITIGGKVTPAPEETLVTVEEMVESAETPEEVMEVLTSDEMMEKMDGMVAEERALAGEPSVVDDLVESEGEEPEVDDAEDEEELYGVEVPEVDEEPEQPIVAHADVDAKGLYYCTECEYNHTYKSKIGKEHLEFAGDPPQ